MSEDKDSFLWSLKDPFIFHRLEPAMGITQTRFLALK